MGVETPLVRKGWRPPGLSVPLPPLSSPAPQNPEKTMVRKKIVVYHPVGAPTCLHKQEVGKPSLNAAQPHANPEGCVHDDPPELINCGKAGFLQMHGPGILIH